MGIAAQCWHPETQHYNPKGCRLLPHGDAAAYRFPKTSAVARGIEEGFPGKLQELEVAEWFLRAGSRWCHGLPCKQQCLCDTKASEEQQFGAEARLSTGADIEKLRPGFMQSLTHCRQGRIQRSRTSSIILNAALACFSSASFPFQFCH